MSSIHLAETQSKNFNYLFLDRQGNLGLDQNNSFLGTCIRAITSFLKLRDYDLFHVFPIAQKELSERELEPLTDKLLKKVGLNNSTLEKIQLLSRYYFDPQQSYTLEERATLKVFIESAKGNSALNKSLNQLMGMQTPLNRVHVNALKALRSFSFETSKMDKLASAFKKVEVLEAKLQKNGELSSDLEEKFSLDELYELESVIQLAPLLADFKKMGLIFEKSSQMGTMCRNIHVTHNLLNRLHKIVQKTQTPELFHFIFYDFPNFSPRALPKMRKITPLMFRVGLKSDIIHGSMSYRSSTKQEVEVHLTQTLLQNRRTLYSQSFKTLAPNLREILERYPEDVQEQFQAFYGKNWKGALIQKFGKILRTNMSNPEAYASLSNPFSRRILGIFGLKSLFNKGDFAKRMQFSSSNQSMCTEFIIKFLMQCYADLEKEIQSDWNKARSRRESIPPFPSLPVPISEETTTAAISPPGMARTLRKSGLVTEVPRPKILDQILDYHSYELEEALNLPRFG